jgi:hypothetical protein
MKSKSQFYWENIFSSTARFIWFTCAELFNGIYKERIDVVKYVYPGVIFALCFVLRIDLGLYEIIGFEWLNLPVVLRECLIYGGLFGGWIIWSAQRAFLRTKMLSRLREAFSYCGLEAHGKLPAFIEDKPLDEHVRRMKLLARGIPLKKFLENKENLEAHLNISVVKMSDDDGDKSRINVLYAMKSLVTTALLRGIDNLKDGEVPIGISYEGPISVNMRDVAHILAAGHTGGGKSNFEKVATTGLVINNPDADVVFLDFKGGMELADLTNKLGESYKNFHKYEGPKACARFLAQLGPALETRFVEIARLGATNLDDYWKKRNFEKPQSSEPGQEAGNKEEPPKRTYIIIDEIAELYSKNPILSKEEIQTARAAVNRVARQGRAGGVHLIVATQKPDASNFDQTLKSNLPGVLCFPMPSQAASISALGTKRAYDLNPEIKGRAVWKYGPKIMEVQTYLFQ